MQINSIFQAKIRGSRRRAGNKKRQPWNRLSTSSVECRAARRSSVAIKHSLHSQSSASMKLKHVDLSENYVYQDAREVNTKFSKTFETFFFPVSEEIRRVLVEWMTYLQQEKLWGKDDPLFPATRIALGATRQFEVAGLERGHWSSASPIRAIFREAFVHAGLPYFNPHSFRDTLVQLGQDICKSPEEFKAWSQNLGHETVLTTFTSYGEVPCQRQGEIIRGLATPREAGQSEANEIAEAVVKKLRDSGVDMLIKVSAPDLRQRSLVPLGSSLRVREKADVQSQ
jgi:hypothetical protein